MGRCPEFSRTVHSTYVLLLKSLLLMQSPSEIPIFDPSFLGSAQCPEALLPINFPRMPAYYRAPNRATLRVGPTAKMNRRQDPVSCSLCRRKKLRCSRQQPCSNCVARGVRCEREVGLPAPPIATLSASRNPDTTAEGDNGVIARLQRVEDLLARLDEKISEGPISRSSADSSYALNLTLPPHSTYPSSGIPSPVSQPRQSLHHRPLQHGFLQQIDTVAAHKADSHLLENVGTRDVRLAVALTDPLQFEVCSIASVVSSATYADPGRMGVRTIPLPTRNEAYKLLAVHEEYIEFLHHVTYYPRTLSIFNDVYDSLDRGDAPRPERVALLTSIFASAMAFQYAIGTKNDVVGMAPPEAQQFSHRWAKATLDCTDTATRLGTNGVEGLQALVTIFFLMYNLEGFSSRSRTGIGLGIAVAKDLCLHRVDEPSMTQHGILEHEDVVDLEIKRRIWWHLTATDWQASVTGGPQEGTYSIQPRHIATRLPRHIEDEDLITQGPTFERPLSIPTASSYMIQRINLAEICRKITDATPLGAWGSNIVRYEDVVALDLEFEKFKRELPLFFQDTSEARETYREVYEQRPSILVQKYTVNIIYQIRRCRLHQPFLVRGFTDQAYTRSRDVCLQSARAVLQITRELDEEKTVGASLLSMSGIHHHMFFAAVALVMDLCFNKTDDSQDTARKAEVIKACRRLEQAKDRSPVAKRFLESLMDVMRKHKIRCFDTAPMAELPPPESTQLQILPVEVPEFDPDGTAQSDFEEIWQSYIENGSTLDVPDWTELFEDLQTKMK